MVFDKEKNVFLFERILLPTNEHEKFKLNMIGCIRAGEEITRAIFGTLNVTNGIIGSNEQVKPKKGK